MKKVKTSEELKKQKNNITFVFVSGRKEPYEKPYRSKGALLYASTIR